MPGSAASRVGGEIKICRAADREARWMRRLIIAYCSNELDALAGTALARPANLRALACAESTASTQQPLFSASVRVSSVEAGGPGENIETAATA